MLGNPFRTAASSRMYNLGKIDGNLQFYRAS